MRSLTLSAVIYLSLTAIIGVDVLSSIDTHIASDHPGDPLLTSAILRWNAEHVPLSNAWWQFPIFYPTADVLAFSEHLLGLSVIATPLYWLTGNALTSYNLTLLLTIHSAGWPSMDWCTGSRGVVLPRSWRDWPTCLPPYGCASLC